MPSTRRARVAARPFVAINCGAIPAELLESELFGHEKGSLHRRHCGSQGRFEIAEGGTLFLDEIGDMSLPMQVKLLRVLQERGCSNVSATTRRSAATSASSPRPTATSRSRSPRACSARTCSIRLNVFPIDLPALRTRIEDLVMLVRDFAERNVAAGRAAAWNPRRVRAQGVEPLSVARQRARARQPDRASFHPVPEPPGRREPICR